LSLMIFFLAMAVVGLRKRRKERVLVKAASKE
jgi:hypothetical protein